MAAEAPRGADTWAATARAPCEDPARPRMPLCRRAGRCQEPSGGEGVRPIPGGNEASCVTGRAPCWGAGIHATVGFTLFLSFLTEALGVAKPPGTPKSYQWETLTAEPRAVAWLSGLEWPP